MAGKQRKWWSTHEIATRWRVSQRTVQRRVETGELPIVKLSPRVNRVSGSTLRQYEQDHELPGDGDAA